MTVFGRDAIAEEVQRVIDRLAAGPTAGERLESVHVDLKEDAGRRQGAEILPGSQSNERAALALAAAAVCMANTPDGGVLVVGAGDDGTLIGTALDQEWVRQRIYDLTQRQLTVTVAMVICRDVRLLLVRSPEAIHPIPWKHQYHHRVNDTCVEIDASTWEAQRRTRMGYDWSAQPSGLTIEAARAPAVQRARDFLQQGGDDRTDLAKATDADLLRRLNVVTGDGRLTNAGALAFVGREVAAIDYVRRDVTGGDSVLRLRPARRGLLEELYDVDAAIASANAGRYVVRGLVQRQVRPLPPRAAREALVNGVAHRDWDPLQPTDVEHIGARLVVTSPGGFIGGVNSDNIITHPSIPRNRSLAELLAALHVAEREGIGVDRMVGDMVRLGYRSPSIDEVDGPYVRTVLLGSTPDLGWMTFLDALVPSSAADDLEVLLLLQHVVSAWWIDEAVGAPLVQRSRPEAREAIMKLLDVRVAGHPVLQLITGVPNSAHPAWTITTEALAALAGHDREAGTTRIQPTRPAIAESWARRRGRISSSELGSIVGAHPTNVQTVLKRLEQEGVLIPGRENRRGAGFYYLPTPTGSTVG